VEFYSVIKKNEPMTVVGKWMELEIVLSEITQLQKDKHHVFSFICRNKQKDDLKVEDGP
jgi:hypothetical protein